MLLDKWKRNQRHSANVSNIIIDKRAASTPNLFWWLQICTRTKETLIVKYRLDGLTTHAWSDPQIVACHFGAFAVTDVFKTMRSLRLLSASNKRKGRGVSCGKIIARWTNLILLTNLIKPSLGPQCHWLETVHLLIIVHWNSAPCVSINSLETHLAQYKNT